MPDPLESLCERLLADGYSLRLHRGPREWEAVLWHRFQRNRASPHGTGSTAVEAVRRAIEDARKVEEEESDG